MLPLRLSLLLLQLLCNFHIDLKCRLRFLDLLSFLLLLLSTLHELFQPLFLLLKLLDELIVLLLLHLVKLFSLQLILPLMKLYILSLIQFSSLLNLSQLQKSYVVLSFLKLIVHLLKLHLDGLLILEDVLLHFLNFLHFQLLPLLLEFSLQQFFELEYKLFLLLELR